MTKEEEKLYRSLLMIYGERNQRRQTIEECSELIKALCKYDRYYCDERFDKKILRLDIISEMADVEIMLDQLKMMLSQNGDFERAKEQKLKRQMERVGTE